MEYTIKKGDTLQSIANSFNIDTNTLVKSNNIRNPNLIYPGQTLKINSNLSKPSLLAPKTSSSKTSASSSSTEIPKKLQKLGQVGFNYLDLVLASPNTGSSVKDSSKPAVNSNNSSQKPEQTTPNTKYYIVLSGDSLSQILTSTGSTATILDVMKLNNLDNPNMIRAGLTLLIPIPKGYTKTNRSFSEIAALEDSYNKDSNTNIINNWYKRNQPGEYYIIDDKVHHTTSVYKDGVLVKSFKSIHGKNSVAGGGTYLKKHKDSNGNVYYTTETASPDDMTITYTDEKGDLLNLQGNLTTPAGVFYSVPSKDYQGAPSWIRKTLQMVDSGSTGGIPSTMHARTIKENANTNGCTGLSGEDLKELKNIIGNETVKTYILPVDETNNKFFIRNNLIQFKNLKSNPNIANYLTLTSTPINNFTYSEEGLDDHLKEVLKKFSNSLIKNKSELIKDLKINDDTYNQLSLYALGILGAESNYGLQHSAVGNFARAVAKYISKSNSSPDVYSKYNTYGATSDANSIGLTQIRYNSLSPESKNLYTKYKINKDNLLNPDFAALATMIKLADEYRRQGRNFEKAVRSWNNASNYYNRIQGNIDKRKFTGYATYRFGGVINYLDYVSR